MPLPLGSPSPFEVDPGQLVAIPHGPETYIEVEERLEIRLSSTLWLEFVLQCHQ